jgi:hypothetical protein
LHYDADDNWLYVLQGVKDIVLFTPEEGALLQLGAPVLDIRNEVKFGGKNGGPPHNRDPPSRGAAKLLKKKQQEPEVVAMTWLNNFATVDLDDPPEKHAKALTPIRATIRAGEALFIPEGWYHNVLSVSSSSRSVSLGLLARSLSLVAWTHCCWCAWVVGCLSQRPDAEDVAAGACNVVALNFWLRYGDDGSKAKQEL